MNIVYKYEGINNTSPFSIAQKQVQKWVHLSVTLQGGLTPLAKLVQTGFKAGLMVYTHPVDDVSPSVAGLEAFLCDVTGGSGFKGLLVLESAFDAEQYK